MTMTTSASTGHLAIRQTVSAVDPRPTALATAVSTGPVRTRISSATAASTTATRVSSSITGRSFQNGRPSSIS